jgi:hypothetical protein
MTKSFLVVAGCLLVASAAWAAPPPSPQGSGNSVNSALAPAAPAAAPTPVPSAGPPPSPQGSGNNVNAALATPKPAPAPAPSNVNASTMGANQTIAFNPMAYSNATDCLNAAAAANQPLSQCKSLAAR